MTRPIGVRGWVRPPEGWNRAYANRAARRLPRRHGVVEILAFDAETSGDLAQRFILGVWRVVVDGAFAEEGIVVADDLAAGDRAVIDAYVASRNANVDPGYDRELLVMSRRQWVNRRFFVYVVRHEATFVGANVAFDLGALARYAAAARPGERGSIYDGGWSLALWGRPDGNRGWDDNGRPRVLVRSLAGHGAFIGFGSTKGTRPPPSRFVDVLTAAEALTGEPGDLAAACEAFGVPCEETTVAFDTLTPELIDHCRADVAPLVPLYEAMSASVADLSGVDGDIARLYSSATVMSRVLGATGLRAPLELHRATVSDEVLGIACAASFAGRAEARIVRQDVPVTVLDWSSQYPCVAALVRAWDHWRAETMTVVDVTAEVTDWLRSDDLADRCGDPATWAATSVTFVQMVPDGDELPHRIGKASRWPLAFGPLRSDDPGWWSWADVAASVILTARAPKVTRAIRLVPNGTQSGLRPVTLADGTTVDPSSDDMFEALVASRRRAVADGDERSALLAKIMVNSLAYGLPGQLNEKARGPRQPLLCWAGEAEPFATSTRRPEEPGRWYWPPIAATVCAGGRLMLALAQAMVGEAGGDWAYCSTDSLAIVATEAGGPVDIEGGPVTALSWAAVEAIRQRFVALNPFGDA